MPSAPPSKPERAPFFSGRMALTKGSRVTSHIKVFLSPAMYMCLVPVRTKSCGRCHCLKNSCVQSRPQVLHRFGARPRFIMSRHCFGARPWFIMSRSPRPNPTDKPPLLTESSPPPLLLSESTHPIVSPPVSLSWWSFNLPTSQLPRRGTALLNLASSSSCRGKTLDPLPPPPWSLS